MICIITIKGQVTKSEIFLYYCSGYKFKFFYQLSHNIVEFICVKKVSKTAMSRFSPVFQIMSGRKVCVNI